MRIVILSFCLLVTMSASSIAAQQDRGTLWLELLSNQPVRFSHGIDLNGNIKFRQYPGDGQTKYAVSEFYLHPVIIDELKIAPEKLAEIEKEFEQARIELEEKLVELSQVSDDDRQSKLEELEEHQRALKPKLNERILSTLSQSQEKRLRQIQLRFLIHQNGFYQTFNSESIGKIVETPLLDAVQFKKIQREFAKTIFRKNYALATEAFAEWLSDFDEEKRQMIEDRWGNLLNRSSGTQQLILQLNSDLEQVIFEPQNPFDLSQSWPEFKHDAAGSCALQKKSTSKLNWSSLAKLNWLHSFVVTEHFKRDIELVNEQVASFNELAKQFYQSKMVINEEIGKKHGVEPRHLGLPSASGAPEIRVVYTLRTSEQLEDFERAIESTADEYYEKYMSVFMPHQLEILEVVVGNMHTRLQGPLAELLWGDVGNLLELSDKDKESLKKKADEARDFLKTESKKIYDESIEQLIILIPEKERPKFRACLGDEFKSHYPNLDGFGVALVRMPVIPEDAGN